MDLFEILSVILEYGMIVLFAGLGLLAVIRTYRKAKRGESIKVPTVGVMNDLPGSVTGINKHDDMSERSEERRDRKTE